MEWLDYLRFLLVLVFVIGLIGTLAWAARRFNFGSRLPATGDRNRLQVIAATSIDARRRLVLIRRDDVEHLLLLGQTQELVVESGISTTAAVAQAERAG